jgi:hypothetical protein
MLAQQSLGPEADAVFATMKTVHFRFNAADCTWYGFWFGFGLMASVFLLLVAAVAWLLDRVPPAHWSTVNGVAWALVVAMGANAVLSFAYFFVGPGALASLTTVLLSVGAIRKQRAAAAT